MLPLLYRELVPWYRLLDPTEDHQDEVTSYRAALERGLPPGPATLLELGAGAGNNAFYLKQRFSCTLTDTSDSMQSLGRELNPDCEHVLGDMRSLRLGRTFDAILVHDAVMYMTTEKDLLAAVQTAFVHTRPGGSAVFAPDCVRETFSESTNLHSGQHGTRALRCLEWSWDPDPRDQTYLVEYGFLLRDGNDVSMVHDRHVEGLFSLETWQRVLGSVGYRVEMFERPLDDGQHDRVFLAHRP